MSKFQLTLLLTFTLCAVGKPWRSMRSLLECDDFTQSLDNETDTYTPSYKRCNGVICSEDMECSSKYCDYVCQDCEQGTDDFTLNRCPNVGCTLDNQCASLLCQNTTCTLFTSDCNATLGDGLSTNRCLGVSCLSSTDCQS